MSTFFTSMPRAITSVATSTAVSPAAKLARALRRWRELKAADSSATAEPWPRLCRWLMTCRNNAILWALSTDDENKMHRNGPSLWRERRRENMALKRSSSPEQAT
eukprot:CAMPEP_0204318108 /NCGR_PEP_ID=MMETSP0469-20131031/6349_1 /ASSEMBLY_ACC=CAM_ASM_000384 /TAXON_ID=2969 /ORGANISM="Oxyrrhis marina" /LENGTH=104 /DNA_ID=CAMNT_0051299121 /DNA_START=338 /DNA_END=652 /DNA_ORIENTATION=+